jgi:ergothioneine biosynthesis protein EgtB
MKHDFAARYPAIRARTAQLAAPLSPEDCQAQSMPDASPVKWHLAHTTWFFETFVLLPRVAAYQSPNPAFKVLYNSYYQAVGEQHPRSERGLVTRPSLAEVLDYRRHVDAAMQALLDTPLDEALAGLVELGLNHEQQHQELLLTDLLHLLSCNPLAPVYDARAPRTESHCSDTGWAAFSGGAVAIGAAADARFIFDNEGPRHTVWLQPYAMARRLVTQGEWLAFMRAGGYDDPGVWLSDGWDWVQRERIRAPLYWRRDGRDEQAPWRRFTLQGLLPLDEAAPVAHLSQYEADAYARWAGARLPTEAEWEHAAGADALAQEGQLWEWTSSAYAAYPGYRPVSGAVGEYNGKFMSNQYVLRGGSRATPRGHARRSYRNFFRADKRWQFMGLRLARDNPPPP